MAKITSKFLDVGVMFGAFFLYMLEMLEFEFALLFMIFIFAKNYLLDTI